MKFIGNKTPVTMAVFKELLPDLQARAFAISGITAADVLQEIRDSLAELPAGGDWNQIKKDVANRLHPFLADLEDPNNTKPAEARAELLLRTHGFQAYATARHAVMERQTDVFPMWQYLTMGDGHVRASHAALNGKILPANHPFWQGHYPPWEWGCRCLVVPLSEADIDAARDEDADKDITEKRILSDHPALMNLLEKEGKVWGQSQSGAIDVRSPVEREGDKPGVYRFNPGSLLLNMEGLEARYTPDVWAQFVAWAKGAEIEPKKTVFAWLGGASQSKPAPTAPAPNDQVVARRDGAPPAE